MKKLKLKISDEKLQSALKFIPHPNQKLIIDSKAKLKVVCAGRRAGKTIVAGYVATKKALEDDQRIWIVAPDFSLTQIVFEEILKNLSILFGSEGFKLVRKPHPVIKLDNGTLIECRSVENPQGMLGRSTDLVIMDEAAVVEREIWQQYLKPTTLDRNADVLMISTPRGLNWFYDFWASAGEGRFHFTSKENKIVFPTEESWEKLKSETPERVFQQEWLAEFVSEAGSVFRGIDNIVQDYHQDEPIDGHSYIVGVDIAKYEDYTAIIVMDRAARKVVYINRFKDIDYRIIKERVIVTARKYNNAKCIIDATGQGDPVVEDLKRHLFVEDYRICTNKAKTQLVDKLSIYIEQGLITIPNNEILIDELKRYAYKTTDSGVITYSAPEHRHDDTVIALALCVWGLRDSTKNEETNAEHHYILHNEYA